MGIINWRRGLRNNRGFTRIGKETRLEYGVNPGLLRFARGGTSDSTPRIHPSQRTAKRGVILKDRFQAKDTAHGAVKTTKKSPLYFYLENHLCFCGAGE